MGLFGDIKGMFGNTPSSRPKNPLDRAFDKLDATFDSLGSKADSSFGAAFSRFEEAAEAEQHLTALVDRAKDEYLSSFTSYDLDLLEEYETRVDASLELNRRASTEREERIAAVMLADARSELVRSLVENAALPEAFCSELEEALDNLEAMNDQLDEEFGSLNSSNPFEALRAASKLVFGKGE